jgi:hypothetical protein
VPARIAGDFKRGPADAGPLCLFSLRHVPADIEDMRGRAANLQLAGALLVVGAAITLGLHYLEVPEDLYRRLYDHLLSGLDVPDEPSQGTVDAIGYVSLIGGLAELVAGAALLVIDRVRSASSQVG